jgi:succinate-semialdehyde dehydrogenase/glutarate-semialdehyde dehydrogenase
MAVTANAQTTPTATGYRVLNPATGAVLEEFATATDAEVQEAIAAAEAGYQVWKDVDNNERAKIVSRVGELFA